MALPKQQVLVSTEVDMYVENLQAFSIEEIGSKKWFNQHEMIEKLNMQAIISASSNETEYVKDALLTFEKVRWPQRVRSFFDFFSIFVQYSRCLCWLMS